MEKLTINQWAEEDRPREKMMLKGAEALSDAELLPSLSVRETQKKRGITYATGTFHLQ